MSDNTAQSTDLDAPLPVAAPDPAPHCGLVPSSDIDGIGSCVRPAGHAGDHLGPDADDIAWQWSPAACIADDPDHAGMTCDQYDAALDAGPAPADGAAYFCPTSGETESPTHGGFDVCCEAPELHRPVPDDGSGSGSGR